MAAKKQNRNEDNFAKYPKSKYFEKFFLLL